jgi:hypothetical protein
MSIIDRIQAQYASPTKLKNIADFTEMRSYLSVAVPDFYTDHYFSPFNLIFLHQLNSQDIFRNDLIFLVRDGLIEMLRFFMRNPTPLKTHKGVLLFPKVFSPFIPAAWKHVSCSYTYIEERNILFGKSENIVVTAHLSPETFDDKKLKKLIQVVGQTNQKLYFLMDDVNPSHGNSLYEYGSQKIYFKKKIFSLIPDQAHFIEKRQIFGLGCHSGWEFTDLDQNMFILDKWSTHYFRSLGMNSHHFDHQDDQKGLCLDSAPFEKINIQEWENGQSYFNDIFLDFKLLKIADKDFYRAFGGKIRDLYLT